MISHRPFPLRALAAACLAFAPAAFAEPENDCEAVKSLDTCDAPNTVTSFAKAGKCPDKTKSLGEGYYCLAPADPPGPVTINCEYDFDGALCEAWPQADTLTYTWSAQGLYFPWDAGPESPFREVACHTSAGSLTVTVHSSSGETASTTVWIRCASGHF